MQIPTLPPLPAVATLNNGNRQPGRNAAVAPRQRFILALDDYHRISDPNVHQMINELLLSRRAPFIWPSTHDPPLALRSLRRRELVGPDNAALHQRAGFDLRKSTASPSTTQRSRRWKKITGLEQRGCAAALALNAGRGANHAL